QYILIYKYVSIFMGYDTSALLDLGERHYPERLPLFRPIWEFLYTSIDEGTVISVEQVKDEIARKSQDWRADFLARAEKMFLLDEAIEREFARVVQEIEANSKFNSNSHRDRFMSGADPWCIALAHVQGDITVVSGEKKNLSSYGLGEVCRELGVRHINVIDLFEENSVGAGTR
ncbi:MAG: DUF4411 family protein, partial [Pseudohongiellaceae bacterium]